MDGEVLGVLSSSNSNSSTTSVGLLVAGLQLLADGAQATMRLRQRLRGAALGDAQPVAVALSLGWEAVVAVVVLVWRWQQPQLGLGLGLGLEQGHWVLDEDHAQDGSEEGV